MNQKLIHVFIVLFAWLTFASGLTAPTHAQSEASKQGLPTRNQAYLRSLISLAETIGSAHAVRVRCNGVDDQYWRTYMVQILGLEAPLQGRLREQMVTGFNDGFERESGNGLRCDARSNEREATYAVKGREISESLAAYYFPKRDD